MKIFGGFLIGNVFGCGHAPTMPEPDCTADQIIFTGQCVLDDPINRVLSGAFKEFGESSRLTWKKCRDYCESYAYFGLENGNQCFCGNEYRIPLEMRAEIDCDMKCPGGVSESCGGDFKMNLWSQTEWTGQCVTTIFFR